MMLKHTKEHELHSRMSITRSDMMCKEPLQLEITGLDSFYNRDSIVIAYKFKSAGDNSTFELVYDVLDVLSRRCLSRMSQKFLQSSVCLENLQNMVLYACIKEDASYHRLCQIAHSVRKHFSSLNVTFVDSRPFVPHLTIGKISIPSGELRDGRSFHPVSYEAFKNQYIGFHTISGIQLVSSSIPRDQTGYYGGETLIFSFGSR
ncbi:hypothetical protein HNY73_007777 [Argiope bruennichi]|uniref:A-kinase anchor protein 7-like phosphoesterase domain-containing protein n=1 Tax=Argiope bruennichi TaxID=94029 RepID=A0A8T0FI33_ARGBR|nr:hypothetical protein HNY73_007777 [Argiope bruennichi]